MIGLTGREGLVRALLVLTFAGLVASLMYSGPPPPDLVHTHHSVRLYAHDEWIEFPLFNYEVRHPTVHTHEDHETGARLPELVHVHARGATLGTLHGSFGLDLGPGRVVLDDPTAHRASVHHGETYEDNATHHWRIYAARDGGPWQRWGDDPVDPTAFAFDVADQVLVTFVPRDRPDDHAVLVGQMEAVLDGLDAYPQET